MKTQKQQSLQQEMTASSLPCTMYPNLEQVLAASLGPQLGSGRLLTKLRQQNPQEWFDPFHRLGEGTPRSIDQTAILVQRHNARWFVPVANTASDTPPDTF